MLYLGVGQVPLQDGSRFRKRIVTLTPETPNYSGASELNRWHTNQYNIAIQLYVVICGVDVTRLCHHTIVLAVRGCKNS